MDERIDHPYYRKASFEKKLYEVAAHVIGIFTENSIAAKKITFPQ